MQTKIIHKGKKLLSLLLVFCMMFGMVPTSVFAEDTQAEPAMEETTLPQAEKIEETMPEPETTPDTSGESVELKETDVSGAETGDESGESVQAETEASATETGDENGESALGEAEVSGAEAGDESVEESNILPDTRALGDPINAALYDDSSSWVNFDGTNDSATIGYASDAEKDYNMQVVLTFPAGATNKSATITLAEGLKFSDDGSTDATVSSLLSGSVGNSTNVVPYGVGGVSMTGTGSKTYSFTAGTEVVTLSLKVRADSRYWYNNAITNAITITMDYNGSQQDEVKLESLTVDSSNKRLYSWDSYAGYAATDANIEVNHNYRDFRFSMASNSAYSHFIDGFAATITVSNPNCVVTNTDPTNWTLDANAASGIYVFKYKGGSATVGGAFTIPVQFNFPSGGFSGGEVVTATRTATASLYGGKTVTWDSRTMTFTLVGGNSQVFVNYETMTSAMNAATSLSRNTTAQSGTTSETLSGAVGYYSVGNKGGTDSDPQTVELHFDQNKLGVLGVDLAIPDGQTVTTVDYQTLNSTGWQTTTGLSLTATSALNTYGYVSWSTLGIMQDPMVSGDYITAIRYTLNSIPAVSILGQNVSATCRSGIYGVTLTAGIGTTADAAVSVYEPSDANDNSKWTTGKIYSDHTKSYAGIRFTNVPNASVTKSAGETFSFSQGIYAMIGSNISNIAQNSAVEHPILYLRSESGNSITNIKIVNSRGTDITSYLMITPTFDGSVWTYKIDTSGVPGDGAALAYHSVHSDGTLSGKNFIVSYDIATQPTDSGTYNYVDMLFVETPLPTGYYNVPTSYAQTAASYGPHNIGTGTGRVFWLPTSNTGSYTIMPRTDVTVGLSAKHHSDGDDAYATWSEGVNPIGVDVGDNSAMDIKLDITNNSGMAVNNQTVIYMPIPKVGDDWGGLMYGSDEFEFSMILKDEIDLSSVLPAGVTGTVTYGNHVTPTDSGDTLNGYTFESWNSAKVDSYNCVKIVLDSLPNSSTPIGITMQVTVDGTMAGLEDGLVDIWSPFYYEDLTNAEGKQFKLWEQGSYLAMQIANIYDITYQNLNGATNSNPATYTYGTGVTSFADPGTRTHYTFAGWYDAATDGNEVTSISATATGDKTLYARWTADSHTVTYKANGGSGSDHVANTAYDADYTIVALSDTGISRTGYTFAGWNTQADGNGTAYGAGNSITISGDVTFYAQWTVNTYGIIYKNLNGASNSNPASYTYGVGVSSFTTPGTRTGYTFTGWYDTAADGNEVTSISTTATGDKTLYARWMWNRHTVTYKANGGTGSDHVENTFYDANYTIAALSDTEFSRMGYTFAGWNTQADGNGTPYAVGSSMKISGDVTLYAQWTTNPHMVTYKANGGTGSDHMDTTAYDAGYTIAALGATGISRTGYTFTGWNTQANDSGTSYAAGDLVTISGDMTLHAQWTVNTYNITYQNLNGASNSNPATYTYGTGVASFTDPGERTGYTFVGWYDAATDGSQVASISKTATGDKTLYARWTLDVCTITVKVVDTDGNSIPGYDWTVNKGYGETFDASAPTIQGYAYQYWKLDGTQKSGDIKIPSVEASATVTLVYQKQKGSTTEPGTDTNTDKGNYQFVKVPNVKNVKAGETVKYTFTGFGNNWGIPLEKYTIIDKPDKGLDFVSANLPAFKNGAGVTYDVVYHTNKQKRTVLHSDIPADQAFSFNAPDLTSGEYITLVSLEFSTVPVGFAVGDSMTMTFKVWDNPPSQTLVNVGILSYKAGDKYKEFVTSSGSSAITLGGYFGSAKTGYFGSPKTGDETNVVVLLFMLLGSVSGVIAIPIIKRRRRWNEAQQ